MAHQRSLFAAFAFLLLLYAAYAGAVTQPGGRTSAVIQINLTLNTTSSTVFIPGIGEKSASTLPTASYTSPPDFYLASFLNGNLKALVFSQQHPVSLATRATATGHVLSLEQNLTNSQSFLVFTTGDQTTISSRFSTVKAGKFLSDSSPSFAFPPRLTQTIAILLNYTDIDIVGNFTFRQGLHRVTLESNKTAGRKVLLFNETL